MVAGLNVTSSEHTFNPQTPRVKREPLVRNREKTAIGKQYNKRKQDIPFKNGVFSNRAGRKLPNYKEPMKLVRAKLQCAKAMCKIHILKVFVVNVVAR